MKTVLLIIFTSLSFSASAQFNTIAPVGSHLNRNASNLITDPKAVVSNNTLNKEREVKIPVTDRAVNWYHPPLKGKLHITSRFGHRRNPFGKKSSEFHSGIDLSAKAGTPIYAMMPGEVVHIGHDSRSGNYIKLRHGNLTVSYCHLIRKPNIPIVSKVFPGQPVAHVGSTGRSTGPHLHLAVRMGRKHINPGILLQYVRDTQQQALEKLSE